MFDIFLINLDASKSRLDFQNKQLQSLNIPYQRLKAVSADDFSQQEYEDISNNWERKLRKTEVACFLSHFAAWQQVAQHNKPILILEDDVLLSSKTKEILEKIYAINMDYHHISLEVRGRKKLLDNHATKLIDGYHLNRLYQDKSGAAAYILTPEGAKILIENKEKYGIGLADAVICRCYALCSFQIMPAAAIQSDQANYYGLDDPIIWPSTITSESKVDIHIISLKYRMLFRCRRIFSQLRIGLRWLKYLNKAQRKYVPIKLEDFSVKR